ncbi:MULTISPECIES: hypothetical protein [Hymenobacter]|uniref:Uncharacterized protein n=1 Tax=Hymenobacter mucosus TaxID=1411120 RepID=A0A239BCN0_9BACT|nr:MULTISPECIES: hypothetical protein [Hymenobacter]MDF7815487.1 hypothetical protein [Hymenobacter sp. YC55]SNS05321.1 hypothetical protein SAMN06269173_12113 [Hymenobacter mucosus]
MLPNLQAIETLAGRITIGATVRSTRYATVQGAVTAIFWSGYFYSIEVAGQHSDNAANYELLSAPQYPGFNYVNPNAQQVLSGKFEIIVPGEGDRIYFADTAQQAISLVAATIGLRDQEAEVAYLIQRAAAGPVNELRWRGQAVGSIVGQLAYVSHGQERPAPLYPVGTKVRFYTGHEAYTVSGIALYKDRLNYGHTKWHYFYQEARSTHHPMSEAHTSSVAEVDSVAA